jgi:hypothetical protein
MAIARHEIEAGNAVVETLTNQSIIVWTLKTKSLLASL